MTFNKWIVGIVILLLAVGFGFVIRVATEKPAIVNNPVLVYVKGDTVKVIEKHYYAVHDSAKAEVKNDTAKATFYNTKVFEGGDTIKTKTFIEYALYDSTFSVEQYMDFAKVREFRIDTIKIEVPTEKIVYAEIPFYKEPLFVYIAGILTVLLTILGIQI